MSAACARLLASQLSSERRPPLGEPLHSRAHTIITYDAGALNSLDGVVYVRVVTLGECHKARLAARAQRCPQRVGREKVSSGIAAPCHETPGAGREGETKSRCEGEELGMRRKLSALGRSLPSNYSTARIGTRGPAERRDSGSTWHQRWQRLRCAG
jgi:hypothetical protein